MPTPSQSPRPGPLLTTGRVDVSTTRLGNFRLRYRVVNGTKHSITSIHLVVPGQYYDSRILPAPMGAWVSRREQGRGAFDRDWLVSWFAASPLAALRPGGNLTLEVLSGAPIVLVRDEGRMRFSSNLSERLLLPWDAADNPVPVTREPRSFETQPVAYPRFLFNPPLQPERGFEEALRKEQVALEIWGSGRHFGEAFIMNVRARVRFLGVVRPGELLLPSLPEFDRMIVGRGERLHLNQDEEATIRLRCFSITYGLRAPPPRLGMYDLSYRFGTAGDEARQPHLEAFRGILAEADRVTPNLQTPLGDDYPSLLIQWALWRKERILAGKPLDIRELEKDLALHYRWSSRRRVYLNPIQVRDMARKLWRETDLLLHPEAPPTGPS